MKKLQIIFHFIFIICFKNSINSQALELALLKEGGSSGSDIELLANIDNVESIVEFPNTLLPSGGERILVKNNGPENVKFYFNGLEIIDRSNRNGTNNYVESNYKIIARKSGGYSIGVNTDTGILLTKPINISSIKKPILKIDPKIKEFIDTTAMIASNLQITGLELVSGNENARFSKIFGTIKVSIQNVFNSRTLTYDFVLLESNCSNSEYLRVGSMLSTRNADYNNIHVLDYIPKNQMSGYGIQLKCNLSFKEAANTNCQGSENWFQFINERLYSIESLMKPESLKRRMTNYREGKGFYFDINGTNRNRREILRIYFDEVH